jgi:hypothetical protein
MPNGYGSTGAMSYNQSVSIAALRRNSYVSTLGGCCCHMLSGRNGGSTRSITGDISSSKRDGQGNVRHESAEIAFILLCLCYRSSGCKLKHL